MNNNIYDTDRIYLQEEIANAVFNFQRKPEGIYYSLTLNYLDECIQLTGKEGLVFINEPCVLLLGNRLFRFDDIDGKKLLPFLRSSTLFIKKETERKFLETFARKIIRTYQVHAEGLDITDRHLKPHAILTLENDLQNMPVYVLRFQYEDKIVYEANRKSELEVALVTRNDVVEFIRINRNNSEENKIITSLLEMGLANTGSSSFIPINLKHSERIFLVYELVNWLNINTENLQGLGIELKQKVSAEKFYLDNIMLNFSVVDDDPDWFDIQAVVNLEGFEIPFIKLRDNLLSGRREYLLPDGRIMILPKEWFARFKDLFSFAREQQNHLILDKQHFPLLDKRIYGFESSYFRPMQQLLAQDFDGREDVPGAIHAKLRAYQKKGYNWLWRLNHYKFGGCLADDMGLGKTLQTLCVLQRAIEEEQLNHFGPVDSVYERQLTIFEPVHGIQGRARPSLVVVPSTLVHNWSNEILKFAPTIKAGYYGGQNRGAFNYYYESFDLIITSYGHIRNDIDIIRNYEFLYLILDESQLIKNPRSKTYKALIQMNSINRLVLTGTPIENSLSDLWAQMNFLNPGLLGSFEFFRNEFVVPIEKSRDENQTRLLKALISPFVMRRTKAEVAPELPKLSEHLIYCEMTESQQQFYETEKSRIRNLLLENINQTGIQKTSILILQSLTRLRQAANHPMLIEPQYEDDSGKYYAVIDNVENLLAEKHKVLVFSSFKKHLDIFTQYCATRSIPYLILTGDVPETRRKQIIEQFQQNSQILLFFISVKAGGYGINLTAADYVFILDPWWNPAVEEQALSRAHRMGQKNKVFVYRFITKDTIEDKIRMLQEKKSLLADKFINTNNPFAVSDKEEILKLFD